MTLLKKLAEKHTLLYSVVIVAFMIGLAALWFFPVLRLDFLADDYDFLDAVIEIQEQSGNPLSSILTTSIGGNSFFRPIINLSFWLNYAWFGASPFGYHLTNIVMFGITAGLITIIAEILWHNRFASLVTGLIWFFGPFNAETVIWIAGRTDLFMMVFLLSALISFLWYRKSGNILFLATLGLNTFFSVLSKENGVVIFPLILLTDIMYGRSLIEQKKKKKFHTLGSIIFPYILVLGIVAIFFLLRFLVLGHFFSLVNDAGQGKWSLPSWLDIKRLIEYFTTGILARNGYEWLGLRRRYYLGLYALPWFISSFFLIISKKKRENIKNLLYGFFLIILLVLPVIGFIHFITNDHQNIRFLWASTWGMAFIMGSLFQVIEQRKKVMSGIVIALFLAVWGMSSWYGQIRYQKANELIGNIWKQFEQQVKPIIQNTPTKGILIDALPRVRNGVYIFSTDIDRAIAIQFPELKGLDVQTFGWLPLENSLLCQIQEKKLPADSVLAFNWQESGGFWQRDFPRNARFDTQREQILINGDGLTEQDGKKLSFPIQVTSGKKITWKFQGEIDPENFQRFIINLSDFEGTIPEDQKPHIRWQMHFKERIEDVPEGWYITIPIDMRSVERKKIVIDLCSFPAFYATDPIRSMSFEWRNMENLNIVVKEFFLE